MRRVRRMRTTELPIDLSKFHVVERPITIRLLHNSIINAALLQAVLKTSSGKAVQFECPKPWQKRVCDAIYSHVRKSRPLLTCHRVCRGKIVTMWASKLQTRENKPNDQPIPKIFRITKHFKFNIL